MSDFNAYNCVAYDLHRKESKAKESIPPCWMCMSEDAKKEIRNNFLVYMRLATGRLNLTEQELTVMVDQKIPSSSIDLWKQAEAAMEQERAKGNPRAFFAE